MLVDGQHEQTPSLHAGCTRTNTIVYVATTDCCFFAQYEPEKNYQIHVHCVQKKTPTYVVDYNSGVSWSIFIFFVPVEIEMNTLQFIYLQS